MQNALVSTPSTTTGVVPEQDRRAPRWRTAISVLLGLAFLAAAVFHVVAWNGPGPIEVRDDGTIVEVEP